MVSRSEPCSYTPKEATLQAKVEDFWKWFQGTNKSIREIHVIGRLRHQQELEPQSPASIDEAMSRLCEQQKTDAWIVTSTSDAGKKQKPAIASLAINLGNGLHMTRSGMNFEVFLTCEIIAKLASRLHEMNNIKESLGDLMQKAVNYLHSFWKQLMAWRNNGNYSIDKNIAERSIRPITLLHKSSLLPMTIGRI